MQQRELMEAVQRLSTFLASPLTQWVAQLEHDLTGAVAEDVPEVLKASGIDQSLLSAGLTVSATLGRVNDLIHAAAICLLLPHILEPHERLEVRPSLAAGNDPSRPYDLETSRRVAEFKLSRWKGSDAERKRQTFKDLVHLAADGSDRSAELYVVGEAPIRFLRTSRSTARWALDRLPAATATLFERRFGSPAISIGEFTATQGRHVKLIDLTSIAPDLSDLW